MPANTDKVRQLHDRLTAQVEALVSGEDWARFLTVASRFHTYSANNVWLILAQRPDATRVAGYRTWQRLGRQVNRGAKGIAILAPCVYRRRPVDEADAGDNPAVVRVLRGFTVVHVFDPLSRDLSRGRSGSLGDREAHCLWRGITESSALAATRTGLFRADNRGPRCHGPARAATKPARGRDRRNRVAAIQDSFRLHEARIQHERCRPAGGGRAPE